MLPSAPAPWHAMPFGLVLVPLLGLAALIALVLTVKARRSAVADAQRFATLLDAAPEAILGVTDGGTIDFANARATELFGYPEAELVGQSIELLVPDRARAAHAALRADYTRHPRVRPMGKGASLTGRRKDGSEFAVEISLNRVPMGRNPVILCMARDVSEQRQMRQALIDKNAALSTSIAVMERRTQELHTLTELGELLQSCQSEAEVYPLIANALTTLFPSSTCGLYLLNSSRNTAELVTGWSTSGAQGAHAFGPQDCWALRRGRTHRVAAEAQSGIRCPHNRGVEGQITRCVPLTAQGETMGVLCVLDPASGEASAPDQILRALAEQCALALANLRLREALRTQSIRDPLTGLFNRRFLEEWLDRELRRGDRQDRPLALLMIDFDYFKRFNDTFGHQCGDIALREICGLLQRSVRASDVVCRLGGEELAAMLPETDLAGAMQVAEHLRADVEKHAIRRGSQTLGFVTISIGVACAPEHARSSEALLHAADEALYRAKHQGRNRVVAAEAGRPATAADPEWEILPIAGDGSRGAR